MTISILQNNSGIERDGTRLDSTHYVDGQWVRFRRGKPKKMGGYRRIAENVNGPVRGIQVWNRQSTNLITLFSRSGVEQLQVNDQFIGATVVDRTPANWVDNSNLTWQTATLYDSAAGSNATLLLAHAANNLVSIDDGTATPIYYGQANIGDQLVALGSEWNVSGGIVAAAPYLIAYGSDGQVIWSNANEPRNATTGDAGKARITDKKIVKGLPIRGTGQSPAVLLWSLDSVIRMSFIGGTAIFKFDTLTSQSSVLSSNGIVEYDGVFYWAGLDRFMIYNGSVLELPNDMNQDFFYDRLNFEQRQKVFAIKVPRHGEIWWFYPSDSSTECNRAVIFNVREKTWYDVQLGRTTGSSSQTIRNPVLVDSEVKIRTTRIDATGVTGQLLIGDSVTGNTSGATGKITKVIGNSFYVRDVAGTFKLTESFTSGQGSGTISNTKSVSLYAVWQHEFGLNKIEGDVETSIKAFVETNDFSFLTGGTSGTNQLQDVQTKLNYVEPDFHNSNSVVLNVVGENAANGQTVVSKDYVFDADTTRIDMREQRRVIRLRFTSDSINGDFEMGKVVVDIYPGNSRA